VRRKTGRNKRKRMGRLFRLTNKERTKRLTRKWRTGTPTGKDKVKVHAKPQKKVK
jgi:polyferredoxin